ncbi:hypothetical protein T265_05956 [Opisthorchis viverrini]|uniref:Uncharacterized protein n=1 Tax=Opisthorchis viverrini TaxID=6198 RepID=A0A074ZIS3_OPIVI|nr:hypothetical protein T265_05956 [Opisthorchis viverrini]KER26901.1 hypothetical protein T265_05956 [Opisthorchis viverrini]
MDVGYASMYRPYYEGIWISTSVSLKGYHDNTPQSPPIVLRWNVVPARELTEKNYGTDERRVSGDLTTANAKPLS